MIFLRTKLRFSFSSSVYLELLPFDLNDIWWLIVLSYNFVFFIIIFAIPIQLILILTHQDRHQGLQTLMKLLGLAALFYTIGIWYGFPILSKTLISHFFTGLGSNLVV